MDAILFRGGAEGKRRKVGCRDGIFRGGRGEV
jgi:hypothetical protein